MCSTLIVFLLYRTDIKMYLCDQRKIIIMEDHVLTDIATQIRRDIVRMVSAVNSGHPGGSLGCADFFTLMYFEILKHDPNNFSIDGKNEDLFFLSNGHISPVWYSSLARSGYFPLEELGSFRKISSRLQGHPSPAKGLPGIRIASGSLGQGLSNAIGAAHTKILNGDTSLVYSLHGDGELQEGQMWEAFMYAPERKLNNLISIIDYNGRQIDGDVDKVLSLGNLKNKLAAFNWNVLEMDGHNFLYMRNTLREARNIIKNGTPCVILMKTEMGKGVDYMMGSHKWHGIAPNKQQLEDALQQLEETLGDY